MRRLSSENLHQVRGAALPRFDRNRLGTGIVHIGLGAFHRAHQAIYTDDVLSKQGGDWMITGVSLRSREVFERLDPQSGLYSVCSRSGDSEHWRIVGSVREVIVAGGSGTEAILMKLADPRIRVITLTVTEKGYLYSPLAKGVDVQHPDVIHDLRSTSPRSMPGFLVRALMRRRQAGSAPVTILSCDNLGANGVITSDVVRSMAEGVDASLLSWIDDNVTFPCSMVDRIVPAATAEVLDRAQRQLGVLDEGALLTEPWKQWVIEDSFAADRPRWEDADAVIARDVAPYEQAKLRLLNGAHSAAAYLGLLCGDEWIHEVLQRPEAARLLRDLLSYEVVPGLPDLPGFELTGYIDSVLQRFSNAAVPYATRQVATDGSKKIPQRLLPSIESGLRESRPVFRLCLAVAAWILCLQRSGLNSGTGSLSTPIADPHDELLKGLIDSGQDIDSGVHAVLSQEHIFGRLGGDPRFRSLVIEGCRLLQSRSVPEALRMVSAASSGTVGIDSR